MYCWNCGSQLPDEAIFCHKCGKQQRYGGQQIGSSLTKDNITLETCEIVFDSTQHLVAGAIFWFWAKAIGPNGEYSAGNSPQVIVGSRFFDEPKMNDRQTKMAHSSLVAALVSDGWEPMPVRGPNWWNYRFQRRARTAQKVSAQDSSDIGEDPLMRAIRPYYPHASPSWLKIGQIRLVRDYLAEDEIPEGVIFAKHPKTGVGGGGLWATNRRLLYVGTNFWGKPVVEEYSYDKIGAIESSADGSVISIRYSGRKIALKGVDKRALLVAFLSLVRKKVEGR